MGVIMITVGIVIGAFFGYCEARDEWYLKGRKDGYRQASRDAERWYE